MSDILSIEMPFTDCKLRDVLEALRRGDVMMDTYDERGIPAYPVRPRVTEQEINAAIAAIERMPQP